jgi:hypothetical protein
VLVHLVKKFLLGVDFGCFTILIVLSFVASHSWFGDDQEWGFICTSFLTTPRSRGSK